MGLRKIKGDKTHNQGAKRPTGGTTQGEKTQRGKTTLALIYNESLAQGTVPYGWRQAGVAPVFKKGGKYGAAGYRPVSLACICCKTLECVVVSNINGHLAFGGILADCQHGFRSQRSCETQLVQFYHDMVSNLDGARDRGQKQTDVIIMDFAGAFDKVPHRRLLCRLGYYGIGVSARGWIGSWLSGRSRGVVLGGRASGPVPVLSGVPQGSVLGQVLFLIFIDDLPDGVGSSVRLFADDCVLCGSVGSPIGCRVLRGGLGGLSRWGTGWRVGFGVARCRSVGVARRLPGGRVLFGCALRRRRLGQVRSAKYLGLTITDDLDWGRHVSEISCRAAGAMGFLRRGLALAPGRAKEVACRALVRPWLGCAAPVWGPCRGLRVRAVERVQRTAARWTCRRWRNTSSVGDMLDELEGPSLGARREQSSLTFFCEIHSGTVSLDKDGCLAPAPGLQRTGASHDLQYTRYFAYSDALKNSFFPRTIPLWNSLPSSVVSSKTIEEFKGLI